MTYRELVEKLQKLTSAELDKDVVIFNRKRDWKTPVKALGIIIDIVDETKDAPVLITNEE